MADYSFEDFKSRIKITDLLEDAGYRMNKKDGYRYPMYVRIDSNGQRVPGDKFMVTGHGNCCVQPPSYKNYNILSFITEHPTFFPEYTPGMSPHRLINLVCNRILNNPVEHAEARSYSSAAQAEPFSMDKYNVQHFRPGDGESQKGFYPYFRKRGIDLATQSAFKDHFCLAWKKDAEKYAFKNLSFPLTVPGRGGVVGFEERGAPGKDGKAYKGKAAGSNASEGLWIANLSGLPLSNASNVLWFESAYDAMSYYQLNRDNAALSRAVYVSTGGNPTERQFKGMLAATGRAVHHLCFDNDPAGRTFTQNFRSVADGKSPLQAMQENFSEGGSQGRQESRHHLVPSGYRDYLNSLLVRDNVFSGEEEQLPEEARKLYSIYESKSEEYYSAWRGGLKDPDALEQLKQETAEASRAYKQTLMDALGSGKELLVIRELPEGGHKDWNEQLLAGGRQERNVREEQDVEKEEVQAPRLRR